MYIYYSRHALVMEGTLGRQGRRQLWWPQQGPTTVYVPCRESVVKLTWTPHHDCAQLITVALRIMTARFRPFCSVSSPRGADADHPDLDEIVYMHVNTVTNISPRSSNRAGRDNGLSHYPHPYWCAYRGTEIGRSVSTNISSN